MEDHEARNVNDLITGLDPIRPQLRTMSVDRKLGGVNAVHPHSRLNHMYPGTKGRRVFDSANPARRSREAFEFCRRANAKSVSEQCRGQNPGSASNLPVTDNVRLRPDSPAPRNFAFALSSAGRPSCSWKSQIPTYLDWT